MSDCPDDRRVLAGSDVMAGPGCQSIPVEKVFVWVFDFVKVVQQILAEHIELGVVHDREVTLIIEIAGN